MRKYIIIFFTVFIDLLGFGILIPLGPDYAMMLGFDALIWGLLMSVFSLMQLIFVPILGRLSDRIGRRPILLISIVGSIVGHTLFGLAHWMSHPLLWLFISRMIAGIGGANIATAQAYVTDLTSEKDRNKSMGLIGASFGLGFTFGPVLGGIVSPLGLAAPFFLAAILSLFNFVFAYFYLPESLKVRQTKDHVRYNFLKGFKVAALEFNGWRPYLMTLILITGFAMLEVSYVFFAIEKFDINKIEASFLFFVIGLQLVLVQGVLIRFLTRIFVEKQLIPIGLLFMSVGLFVVPLTHSFKDLLLLTPIITLGNGMVQPSVSSYISKLASPTNRGMLLGYNQSFGSLARIIGPLAGGWLYASFGSASPFHVGSAILLCGCLFSLSLKKI